VDRTSDPCPDFGAVLEVQAMAAHVLACPRHPALVLALEWEARLGAALGARAGPLLALVRRRNALRDELRLLADATDVYDADMGWDGVPYSKPWSEEPWRGAVARARQLLAAPGDLGGVTAAGPAGREAPANGSVTGPPGDAALASLDLEGSRLAQALSGLTASCDRYWGAMSDGDRGKSFENPAQVPQWRAARLAAREVLASMT